MGMYDRYAPDPSLICPVCGEKLTGWQGKSGPCLLLTWHQGTAEPQTEEDTEHISLDDLKAYRLPEEFLIWTDCCSLPHLITAIGQTENGIWTETRLMKSTDVDDYLFDLPKERRNELKSWLKSCE